MSTVKRKLNNESLIQKCKVIRIIEKGVTNKALSEKSGTPRNAISTWMKNKKFGANLVKYKETSRM